MKYRGRGGSRVCALGALACLLAIVGGDSTAGGQIWTGLGTSDAWSDPANWYLAPPASGAETEVSFGSAFKLTPYQDIADPFVLGRMRFLSSAGQSYVVGGYGIQLSGASAGIIQDSPVDQEIDNQLLLRDQNGSYELAGDGAGALVLAGGITASGGTLTKSGSAAVVIGGQVSGLGSIHLRQGTLRLGGSELISASTALISEAGSLFDLNGEEQRFDSAVLAGTTRVQGALRLGRDFGPLTSTAALIGSGDLFVHNHNFTSASPSFTGRILITFGTARIVDGALGRAGYALVTTYGKLQLNNLHYSEAKPLMLSGGLETFGDSSYAGPISFEALGYVSAVDGTLRLSGAINSGNFASRMGFLGSNGTVIVDGAIGGDGGVVYGNSTGRLVINADSPYYGRTFVNSGVVEVNATLTNTDQIEVHGGTLRGSGSAPRARLEAWGTLQPGAGVGRFTVLRAELLNFGGSTGRYEAEIIDPNGAAGIGYDQLKILGDLSMPGTFVIAPMSLASDGTAGPLAGFDNHKSYDWTIISAGWLADSWPTWQFALDSSGFTQFNDLGDGRLSVEVLYPNVMLRFTPAVPEPAFVGGLLPLALLGTRGRRESTARSGASRRWRDRVGEPRRLERRRGDPD